MSAHFIPDQGDDSITETNDSPGCRLRGARQMRGLSVEQAAAQLHLAPDIVLAMERDDYAALQGHVFVVGYMRNYARLVMLDPEPLLDKYRATVADASAAQPRQHAPMPRKPETRHLPAKLFAIAVIVGVGALAFIWWYSQYGSTPGPGPGPEFSQVDAGTVLETDLANPDEDEQSNRIPFMADTQTPIESDPQASARLSAETATPAPETDMEATPEEKNKTPASALAPAPKPQPVAEPGNMAGQTAEPLLSSTDNRPVAGDASKPSEEKPDKAENTPATEAAADEIVIAFSGPCWVDIRDSERQFKLFGEMSKGDRHILEGTPPYSVIIGNASAASITVGGAPFDLSGISRGNVARFTLDPDQLP